ncbi:hypothetical protein EON66_06355 [archaeon]|nr:MAG: hypothetical protein EON66_06355 [archaeon]
MCAAGFLHAAGTAAVYTRAPLYRCFHYPVSARLQAWIVWKARAAADANMRRCLVQAYAVAFALTALALLRAQLTESADTDFNSYVCRLRVCGCAATTGQRITVRDA